MANKRVQATLYSAPDPWRWHEKEYVGDKTVLLDAP
jgi:hypothetical protein